MRKGDDGGHEGEPRGGVVDVLWWSTGVVEGSIGKIVVSGGGGWREGTDERKRGEGWQLECGNRMFRPWPNSPSERSIRRKKEMLTFASGQGHTTGTDLTG